MSDIVTTVHTQVHRTYRIRLTGAQLISLLNAELEMRRADTERVPQNAYVSVNVPGGLDQDDVDCAIDEMTCVEITWSKQGEQ